MSMKQLSLLTLGFFFISPGNIISANPSAAGKEIIVYKDKSAKVEDRVNDLLGRMTLEEKVMQLNQYVVGWNDNENNIGVTPSEIPLTLGSLIYMPEDAGLRNEIQDNVLKKSRLGIPLIFGYDVIHGFRTIFPIPLAQACSWNPQLVENSCKIAAQEAKQSGVDWTFSPMLDIARDPRWGRVAEGYGEDPYAAGVYGAAAVRGYQGECLSGKFSIAACLKHFVGYGASEAGRDYVYSEISGQSLWDTYLPPFKAALSAGAVTVMSAFNDISGTPASANSYILNHVLRDTWGFNGFVVSDWNAIAQLINQGMAPDLKTASKLSLNAGVDMDMIAHGYDTYLKELVDEGKVSMKTIDEAVKRILRVKFMLGLFENPFTESVPSTERFLTSGNRAAATKMAEESMVLLKNNGLLPLKSDFKRIAVMGPLAKNGDDLLGCWSGHGVASDVKQLFECIEAEFGKYCSVKYARGCDFDGADKSGFTEALNLARASDVVIMCMGEKRSWSGENNSRACVSLPDVQKELIKLMAGAGKKVVLVLANGRPLVLDGIEDKVDAILDIWHPGTDGAPAMAGILSGRVNPSGRLAVTFPLSQGQIPIYYNRRSPARTGVQGRYTDMSSEPMYPFGYGLSYSEFEYGNLTSSAKAVKLDGRFRVEVSVTNVSAVDGMETVFWFIQDPYNLITRPMKELKHFEKRMIRSGETQKFVFDIDVDRDLSFVDSYGKKSIEEGMVYIIVKDKRIGIELVKD